MPANPLLYQQHRVFARSHWRRENNLHWAMDVAFTEDAGRVRTAHAVRNLTTLRRGAAFLFKASKQGTNRTRIKGRKKSAAGTVPICYEP